MHRRFDGSKEKEVCGATSTRFSSEKKERKKSRKSILNCFLTRRKRIFIKLRLMEGLNDLECDFNAVASLSGFPLLDFQSQGLFNPGVLRSSSFYCKYILLHFI